jgi:hypothetical protein
LRTDPPRPANAARLGPRRQGDRIFGPLEMMMKTPGFSEADAKKASERPLFTAGWYPALFREAVERESRRGNAMIEVIVVVTDAHGNGEREFRDYLSSTAGLGAAKLRHACGACGPDVLARYEAGEVSQDDFPGKTVRVKLDVERRRGYEPRNVIVDYAPPTSAS